jgi:hypothetical protein
LKFKIVMQYIYGWKEKCNNDCVDSSSQECTTFPNNYNSCLKLLGATTVTRSNFYTEDLQMSGVTEMKFIRHEDLARGTLVFRLF